MIQLSPAGIKPLRGKGINARFVGKDWISIVKTHLKSSVIVTTQFQYLIAALSYSAMV